MNKKKKIKTLVLIIAWLLVAVIMYAVFTYTERHGVDALGTSSTIQRIFTALFFAGLQVLLPLIILRFYIRRRQR